MSKATYILAPAPHPARLNCLEAVRNAPEGWAVTIQEPTRNLEQNAKLWAMLKEVSRIDWHGQKLTPEEWKIVFTAALKRQKVVPGLDGGFVVLGTSTSRMGKREFSDLLEVINAFAAEHGIAFVENAEPIWRIA